MTIANREQYIPIDERDPASVRAVILARTSNPGGSADDVESQIAQCRAFLARMGWTLIHPDGSLAYIETKTGVRQVRRPVLDSVLALAQQGALDVIVTTTPARIARKKSLRYAAIETASRFGCEFRFAARAESAGKYPGGIDGLLEQFKDDLFDAEEARVIVERTTPGRLARYAQGLPHGGRTGPDYGYAEGERRYKQGRDGRRGRPLGCLTWEIDEPKARWVRWLFECVDTTDLSDLSYRKLAALLEAAGAPTATGRGHWSATQISRMLHNGKYGAAGQNLRNRVEWGSFIRSDTREVFEEYRVRERPDAERYPISPDACPPIIAPALWERVQAKVTSLDAHPRQRFGPRRCRRALHAARRRVCLLPRLSQ